MTLRVVRTEKQNNKKGNFGISPILLERVRLNARGWEGECVAEMGGIWLMNKKIPTETIRGARDLIFCLSTRASFLVEAISAAITFLVTPFAFATAAAEFLPLLI